MPLPSSGQLSFDQIRTEHGGSGAVAMNNYYQGGSVVAFSSENTNIPTSGQISVSNFYSSDGYGSGTGIVFTAASSGGKLPSIGLISDLSLGTAIQSSCKRGGSGANMTFTECFTGVSLFCACVLDYGASAGSSSVLTGSTVTARTGSFSGPIERTGGPWSSGGSGTESAGYYSSKTSFFFNVGLTSPSGDLSNGTTYYCTFS